MSPSCCCGLCFFVGVTALAGAPSVTNIPSPIVVSRCYGVLLLTSLDITVVSCAALDAVSYVISAGGSAMARVSAVVAFLQLLTSSLLIVFLFLAYQFLLYTLPLSMLFWGSML